MERSEGRILVTHVGSFPRPPRLRELLVRQERGEPLDEAELGREVDAAVGAVVGKQLDAGIDIGNDGEQPRVGFSTYVARRLRGFGGESRRPLARDLVDFPDYAALLESRRRSAAKISNAPQAVAEVEYVDLSEAAKECDLFLRATAARPRKFVERFIGAIKRAPAKIPADRIRLHVCWGNYDGPHTSDVPLEAILPVLYRARVGALSLELANPRHQHEYKVIGRHPVPDAMLFLPGVIDSTTNFVEHPEVVADRISQAVDAVGEPTRVIASVDCGFGTFAGSELVAESVVWAKLRALKDGAAIASARLWGS